jgi:hypothetical protein
LGASDQPTAALGFTNSVLHNTLSRLPCMDNKFVENGAAK